MRNFRLVVGATMGFLACVGSDPDASSVAPGTGDGGSGDGNPTSTSDGSVDANGNVDGGGDAATPRCDSNKAFGDPQPVAWPINELAKDENAFSMTSDELIAVIERGGDILYTSRASKSDPFPAPTYDKVVSVSTANDYEGSPSLSADGMNLYFIRVPVSTGNGTIMVAHRSSLVDSFDPPTPVTVDGSSSDIVERVVVNRLGNHLVFRVQDYEPTYIADRTGGNYATFASKRDLAGVLDWPTFSADDLTFYFVAADDAGAPVMRYATRMSAGGVFGAQIDMPANLKVGFEPLHVTDDHCILYVRTAKGSDAGRYDIWEARRPN